MRTQKESDAVGVEASGFFWRYDFPVVVGVGGGDVFVYVGMCRSGCRRACGVLGPSENVGKKIHGNESKNKRLKKLDRRVEVEIKEKGEVGGEW